MKTSLKTLTLALLSLLLAACTSTKIDLTSAGAVAMMTVFGNGDVPWYEEEDPNIEVDQLDRMTEDRGILSTFVNGIINKDSPEYLLSQDRINDAALTFVQTMRSAGITVIDPSTFETASAYESAQRSMIDRAESRYPAEGYNAIQGSPKKRTVLMAQESGAATMLYVNFEFQKQRLKEGRNQIVKARVVMSVTAENADGKKIIEKEYTALSDDFSFYEKAAWDVDKICSLFHDVVQTLSNEFVTEYFPNAVIGSYGADTEPGTQDAQDEGEAADGRETILIPVPNKEESAEDAAQN